MMGTNDTSACGCPVPPCAHLNVPTPIIGNYMVGTDFTWQTTLDHLVFGGLLNPSVDYYFVFRVQDDFCPVPGSKMVPVKIVLKDFVLQSPQIGPYQQFPNGDVKINWDAVQNDTTNSFRYYLVYYKHAENADFQVLDTVFNLNQEDFIHYGATSVYPFFWYYIKTVSGHAAAFQSSASNILTNFFVGIQEDEPEDLVVNFDPTSGELTVSNLPAGAKDPVIQIYNATGQLVFSNNLKLSCNSGRITGFKANAGVYLYRISGLKKDITGKLRVNK
jgi:hypothetical protein